MGTDHGYETGERRDDHLRSCRFVSSVASGILVLDVNKVNEETNLTN